MANSVVLAYAPEEHVFDVLTALRGMLEQSTFEQPLPDDYSIFIMGSDEPVSAIAAYGLDQHADTIMGWLEHHEQAHQWQLEVPSAPEPLGGSND